MFFGAGGDGGLPISALSQYGIAGVLLSILLWFAWYAYQSERSRANANELEIRRLNTIIAEQTVPSLEKATIALTNANDTLKEAAVAIAWYDHARGEISNLRKKNTT